MTYAGMQDLLSLEETRAYARAKRELLDVYRAVSNRPEALITLANFQMAEGQGAEAINLYERALQINPRSTAARVNIADALRTMDREERAESVLREGIALGPSNADLHHALGLSLVRSGRLEDALEELQAATALAPENSRYAYVLGIALNSIGKQQEALEVLRDAHRRFDASFDVSMALATILSDRGDVKAALEVTNALAERHPDERSVHSLQQSLNANP